MITTDPEIKGHPAATSPWTSDEKEISVLDLLIVLAKRKRFIMACMLAFGVVAAIVSLLLPNRYTATTVIMPPQTSSPSSALMAQLSALGSMGSMASVAGAGLGIKSPVDMYIALIKSRTVEDAMVQRFALMTEYRAKRLSDARKELESNSEVRSSPKAGLIEVSITAKDPARAAEMANAYVEEYRKLSSTLAITEAAQRRLFFEQQLVETKENLNNAEEAFKKTQQTTGLIEVDSQARALIQSAASLRAQIAAKEVQIQAMRIFASDQNPDLIVAEQQLAGWKAQLSHLGVSQNGSGDDLLIAKGKVPEAGLEYLRRLRDVKYYETMFELLAKQLEMAKLDEARQGSLIQVVDRAIVPDKKSSPQRTLIVLTALVAGFLMAVIWSLIASAIENARKRPENEERFRALKLIILQRNSARL
jgi:tyrosine-protein kinase Etk/Wzc